MFVKTINTFNFQGLKGLQSFDFDKITALAQPNGSGKTSLINALRFGLTGTSPKGNMISQDKFLQQKVRVLNITSLTNLQTQQNFLDLFLLKWVELIKK